MENINKQICLFRYTREILYAVNIKSAMLNLWIHHMTKAENVWEASSSLHPHLLQGKFKPLNSYMFLCWLHYRIIGYCHHTAQRFHFCLEIGQLNAHQTNHKRKQTYNEHCRCTEEEVYLCKVKICLMQVSNHKETKYTEHI